MQEDWIFANQIFEYVCGTNNQQPSIMKNKSSRTDSFVNTSLFHHETYNCFSEHGSPLYSSIFNVRFLPNPA